MFALCIEHANTGRPVDLVGTEGEKVDVEVNDVHPFMGDCLGTVNGNERTCCMCSLGQFFDGVDGAEHIGGRGH